MKYTHSMIMLTGFTMKASDMKYYSQYINKFLPKDVKINYIYPVFVWLVFLFVKVYYL